jgi:hypothetical protein
MNSVCDALHSKSRWLLPQKFALATLKTPALYEDGNDLVWKGPVHEDLSLFRLQTMAFRAIVSIARIRLA